MTTHDPGFILIVDDNPANLSVLSDTLGAAGFRFRVAMNGEDALVLVERSQPDLILLDVQMPGIDGFEVCRQLKAAPATAAIPIIFTTVAADLESKAKAFALGAVDYVTKPFQQEEVLARVRVHWQLYHLTKDLKQELGLRQQVENKLRQNEQRYRSLYENTPVMLHSIDSDGRLVNVSNYWLTKLGYERHEVLGKRSTDFLTEESRRYAMDVVLPEYFQTGECWEIPYQMVSKTGDVLDVLLSATSEYDDEAGQFVRSLAFIVDVTERNHAQAALIQAEKMAALGRLIGGITHELRNPLNFIKNFAEGSIELGQDLLETFDRLDLAETSSDRLDTIHLLMTELQENSVTICNHSQRAAEIIDSMLHYGHPDPKQLHRQPVQLSSLLDRSIKLVTHSTDIQNDRLNLNIQTDYAVDSIEAIPSSLTQAFINLIDNACDSMGEKQRGAHAQGATDYIPTLTIATRRLKDQVEIRIRDNGCGIEPTIKNRILDPFFTTKVPSQGTGLGLSITHDIIANQHQGTLAVDTELGQFTEFIVTLPDHVDESG